MFTPPIILLNFKLYQQGSGESAVTLAKIVEKVQKDTKISFGICVQALDVHRVASQVSIPVLGQDFDPFHEGSRTGSISPLRLKESGAKGSLINHSERQKENKEHIGTCIKLACEIDFHVVCCAQTPEEATQYLEYNPYLIAVEPPELIGGDVSISKAKPEIIEKAVKLIGGNRLLVGAGVKTGEDFKIALSLGACGVLLASGVVCADDPEKVLREMVEVLI